MGLNFCQRERTDGQRPLFIARQTFEILLLIADDLDPVWILAHQIIPELGEHAGLFVDRIAGHAVGQLADRQ